MQDSSRRNACRGQDCDGASKSVKPFYPSALSCRDNRFQRAWTLLAHTYKAEFTSFDNVVGDTQSPAMIGRQGSPRA